MDRREFIKLIEGAAALAVVSTQIMGQTVAKPKVKAVAFDAFPIFDPRPIFALAEELFQGKGAELANAWRTRQFEYTWLRSMANRYEDFWKITGSALDFAAKSLKLELTGEKRAQLMDAYLNLKIYPDVLPALKALKEKGIRLGFLSNFTPQMLAAGIKNSGLETYFEQVLSTDRVRAFKPSPAAYQIGLNAFRLKKEEIVFAAFAGWDAVGAKWFGYKTFWVNRQGAPVEELGMMLDGTGTGLNDLVNFVK